MWSSRARGPWLFVVSLVAVGLAAVRSDGGAPPPPRFWSFTIANGSTQPVTDIELKLYTVPLESEPVVITIAKLKPGSTWVVGTPNSPTTATFGVAKIEVRASCPAPLPRPLVIVAEKGDFDVRPEFPGEEYCGFAPASNPWYPPTLDFTQAGGQGPVTARLHGRSNWEAHWSPVIQDTLQFP